MKTSSENHSLVHTISQPYLWDASPDIPLHRHIVAIDKGNGQNGNGWENYSIGCKEILMYSSRKGNQIYFFQDIIKQESHQQRHQHDHWLDLKRLFLGF